MQIKLFSVPLEGGEAMTELLNKFLRGHKVLRVESQLVVLQQSAVWAYEVRYLQEGTPSAPNRRQEKVDYEKVLDAASWERFKKLKTIRKTVAEKYAVPAYAVFRNEELAEIAKLEKVRLSDLKKINGIGDGKIERYAQYFIDETHEPPSLADL